MRRIDRHYAIGTILIIFAAIALALITTCAKLAYEGGATPMTLVWLRIVAVLALIGPMQWLRGRKLGLPLPVLKRTLGLAVALLMMSIGYLSSVAYISVSLAVILLYTFPLMVGVLAPLVGRERMTPAKTVFLLGTFGGLVIACWPTLDATLDWRGIALALIGASGVAVSVTYGAEAIGKADPLTVNLWSNLWMFAAASLFVALGAGLAFPTGWLGWVGAAGVAGGYVLGFSAIFTAMPRLPPAQIALILNLEPMISTLSAVLILKEGVAGQTWLGILIMLAFLAPATLLGARPAEAKTAKG